MCTKLFSLPPKPSFSLFLSVPLVAFSMSQRQTKPRTSYAGRIIAEDPFFRFRGMSESHPPRCPDEVRPGADPALVPLSPAETRGAAKSWLRDALGMLNAQMCNCIVKWKNLPRDVDGTIMGQIIISSTPRGGGRCSPPPLGC